MHVCINRKFSTPKCFTHSSAYASYEKTVRLELSFVVRVSIANFTHQNVLHTVLRMRRNVDNNSRTYLRIGYIIEWFLTKFAIDTHMHISILSVAGDPSHTYVLYDLTNNFLLSFVCKYVTKLDNITIFFFKFSSITFS